MAELTVLSPRAERYLSAIAKVERPWDGDLRKKKVAFVNNGRPNAQTILAMIEKRLIEQFEIEPVWVHKAEKIKTGEGTIIHVDTAAPNLAYEVDAAINGVGS